jgi:hypothetical protein
VGRASPPGHCRIQGPDRLGDRRGAQSPGADAGEGEAAGAINLAVHLGATRIVLLGADMRAAANGKTHHYAAPHKWPVKPGCWAEQMRELKAMAEPLKRLKVDVVNCSPVSLIDWWPKRTLDSVLGDCLPITENREPKT